MKILKAETTALRAFLQFNSWSEARNHGLPDYDGKAVNSLLGFARQIPVCRDDAKSGFILEIIDGRELPEYMTMNKGKICG
jgi:hypothetical protein